MATVKLQHPQVNGGTAVVAYSTKVDFSWKNMSDVNPIEASYDIVESNYSGFENPKIVISGRLDVDNLGSNEISQKYLVDFSTLRSTTPITLTVETGNNSTALQGRPSSGYNTSGANSLSNSLKIQIDSFDVSIKGSDSDLGHNWSWTINAHETK